MISTALRAARRAMTAAVVVVAALAVDAAPAAACTCASADLPAAVLLDTDYVFVGRLIAVSRADGVMLGHFEVESVLAGHVRRQVVVQGHDACGPPIWGAARVGASMVVLAREPDR